MEKNNGEKNQKATKTVCGKKRKRITITNHDADKKRSWSDMSNDILESIKKRLFFLDQVKFRLVCKSWSCIRRVPSLQQIPWLLVFDNKGCSDRKEKDIMDSCKLVNSKNKKAYTIDANVIKDKLKIKNLKNMKVHESKYGWLLISNLYKQHNVSTLLFLYSPFFSEGYNFIKLPVLNCNLSWATFTCNPLDKDCKILALNMNFRDCIIYTYSRGQGSWSSQKFPSNSIMQKLFYPRLRRRNWIYSEGNFYFVTIDGTMGKFDMVLGKWNVFPVCAGLPKQNLQSLPKLHHYIVKSSDRSELFLISDSNMKRISWKSDYNSEQTIYSRWGITNTHHIHRLDLSSMTWEDLDSIGDHVLFIGDGYNSILNSSVLKSNGERKGVSDKIYYCEDNELKYISVQEYTCKTEFTTRSIYYHKQNCSRHYGPIALKRCRKMLIDPPPC